MASTQSSSKSTSVSAPAVPHGRFVWYDLMTSDPAGAQRFYERIAGWGTQEWEGGNVPYTMWTLGNVPIGGIMPIADDMKAQGVPPHWLASVCVTSVDETLAQARKLGATVHFGPEDIPTVGRYAVIADPQGASIGLFTPLEGAPGHEGEPQRGEFSWHELATTDYKAAWDFYSRIFDWEKTSDFDMGNGWIYQMYGQHGQPYGGIYDKPADMPAPPHWLLYIQVADANASVELVKELGGQVLNGPMEVPGGDMVAQCMDPQGAAFAVHGRKV